MVTDWRQHAACRGREKEWRAVGVSPRRLRAAKTACLRCPVYDECRDWVLDWPTWEDPCPVHVVAAMTPADRAAAWRPSMGAAAYA